MARRHGGDAVHVLPAVRLAQGVSRRGGDHLRPRAHPDEPAGRGPLQGHQVQRHHDVRGDAAAERVRDVRVQHGSRVRGGVAEALRARRRGGEPHAGAALAAPRLRPAAQGVARVQYPRRARRSGSHGAPETLREHAQARARVRHALGRKARGARVPPRRVRGAGDRRARGSGPRRRR